MVELAAPRVERTVHYVDRDGGEHQCYHQAKRYQQHILHGRSPSRAPDVYRRAVVPAFSFNTTVIQNFLGLRKDGVLQTILAVSHRLVHDR